MEVAPRSRVEGLVDLDVAVGVQCCLLPDDPFPALGRQLLQGGPLELTEEVDRASASRPVHPHVRDLLVPAL